MDKEHCPVCGQKVDEKDTYCTKCGNNMITVREQEKIHEEVESEMKDVSSGHGSQ